MAVRGAYHATMRGGRAHHGPAGPRTHTTLDHAHTGSVRALSHSNPRSIQVAKACRDDEVVRGILGLERMNGNAQSYGVGEGHATGAQSPARVTPGERSPPASPGKLEFEAAVLSRLDGATSTFDGISPDKFVLLYLQAQEQSAATHVQALVRGCSARSRHSSRENVFV